MSDTSTEGIIDAIRSSYAARLGLALLVAVALLLVLGFAVHAQTAAQVREDARTNLQTSAAIQSDEINEWMKGNKRQVRTISQLPALRSDDPSAMNAELKNLVGSGHVSDEVVAIHVVSKDEKKIIASSRPDKFVGKSPAKMNAPFVPKLKAGFTDTDEVYVSEPFNIPIVKFPIVAMLSQVPGEDRVVVFMINPTTEIADLRQPIEGGRTYVMTVDGTPVAAPNNVTLSGPATDRAIKLAADTRSGQTGVVTMEDGSLVGYAAVESHDWIVLTHVDRAQAFAMIDTVRTGIGAMVLAALLTLGIVGLTIGRNTATALRSLADDARGLGEGDLETTFDVERSDEIGTLAGTLAETRDSLRERIEQLERLNRHLETKANDYQTVMRETADGDFTSRMDPQSENEAMAEIAEAFNEMMGDIEGTTADLKAFADEVATASEVVTASSEEVYSASEQVTESIQEISDGADDQHKQLQAVADEMSGLSATTEEIAASSNEVAGLAEETAHAGRRGREAAREAIEGLDKIETTSDEAVAEIEKLEAEMAEIDELVEFITKIATQTNMLALNASIEVSRSSAQGGNEDGFAAVADKIKELADEAKVAAEDVEQRLEQIRAQTERTGDEVQSASDQISEQTDSIERAVDSLEEIATYAQETNTGIQNISEATEQQADSTQEVVTMVDDVANISETTTSEAENVAAAAEEQTTALTEVSRSASDLTAQAERLSGALNQFQTDTDISGPLVEDADLPDDPDDGDTTAPPDDESASNGNDSDDEPARDGEDTDDESVRDGEDTDDGRAVGSPDSA